MNINVLCNYTPETLLETDANTLSTHFGKKIHPYN